MEEEGRQSEAAEKRTPTSVLLRCQLDSQKKRKEDVREREGREVGEAYTEDMRLSGLPTVLLVYRCSLLAPAKCGCE